MAPIRPTFRRRLNEIFERLDATPGIRELVVGTMILQHIGAPTDLGTLADFPEWDGSIGRALLARCGNCGARYRWS